MVFFDFSAFTFYTFLTLEFYFLVLISKTGFATGSFNLFLPFSFSLFQNN